MMAPLFFLEPRQKVLTGLLIERSSGSDAYNPIRKYFAEKNKNTQNEKNVIALS